MIIREYLISLNSQWCDLRSDINPSADRILESRSIVDETGESNDFHSVPGRQRDLLDEFHVSTLALICQVNRAFLKLRRNSAGNLNPVSGESRK